MNTFVYLLFVTLMNGDEYQLNSYETFEECDKVAIQVLNENKDAFGVRCVLEEISK